METNISRTKTLVGTIKMYRDKIQSILNLKVYQNAVKRTQLGLIMLSAFIYLFQYHPSYAVLFTICLTSWICFELISIVKSTGKPFVLNKFLIAYLSTIIYSVNIVSALGKYYPKFAANPAFANHRSIAFSLYAIGLMVTISNLRKKQLSRQLLLFAVIHLSCTVLGKAGAYAIRNLINGSFYYFYPAVLVISNDIGAYVVGKTKLYKLSPKKTVEGFIGAAVFTFFVSMALIYIKLTYAFLPDRMDVVISRPVNPSFWMLNFPVAYLHGMSFALFASFVAPFIGFLASAIKRAFKKKDFGHIIPGHGGMTDRMDCQLMMVFFTYFYLKVFLKTRDESIANIIHYISGNFSHNEIEEIKKGLSSFTV